MSPTDSANRAFQPRDYQRECLEAIPIKYRAGIRRQLTCLPTGSGKTVIFAEFSRYFRLRNQMLVLAHCFDLIGRQARKSAIPAESCPLPIFIEFLPFLCNPCIHPIKSGKRAKRTPKHAVCFYQAFLSLFVCISLHSPPAMSFGAAKPIRPAYDTGVSRLEDGLIDFRAKMAAS